LTQKLSSQQILPSSYEQFDEPTPLQIKGQRYFVFPITSNKGMQVTAFAVAGTEIDPVTSQVQFRFFKTTNEIIEWAKKPVFTPQSIRDVFSDQQTQPQTQPGTTNNSSLEKKIDNLTETIKALTEAINKQKK
jgi:hypothetical protein